MQKYQTGDTKPSLLSELITGIVRGLTVTSIFFFAFFSGTEMRAIGHSPFSAAILAALGLLLLGASSFAQFIYGTDQEVPKFHRDGDSDDPWRYWGYTIASCLFFTFMCSINLSYPLIGTFIFANAAAWYVGWRCQ